MKEREEAELKSRLSPISALKYAKRIENDRKAVEEKDEAGKYEELCSFVNRVNGRLEYGMEVLPLQKYQDAFLRVFEGQTLKDVEKFFGTEIRSTYYSKSIHSHYNPI